jgi:hypothetical protein
MRIINKRSIHIMMSVFIFSTLMSCNPSGTKEKLGDSFITENDLSHQSPQSQLPISPTGTAEIEMLFPELLEGDEIENASEIQPTQRPTHTPMPTSTIDPIETCHPFPDDIHRGPWGTTIIRCGSYVQTYSPDDPPSEIPEIWRHYDYTSLTGRIAYEKDNNDLWVFDYWTDESTRWLDENVQDAKWGPMVNAELGGQPLAILTDEGNLELMTAPGKITHLVDLGEAHSISWSPKGDRIAYLKDNTLYTISLENKQPRKLAENIEWDYTWAIEHNAIFVPGPQIRVVPLDGSDSFVPKTPDGDYPPPRQYGNYRKVGKILWSPKYRLLIFGETYCEGIGCDGLSIYKLSDDLRVIEDFYIKYYGSELGLHLFDWVIPDSIVDSNSYSISIQPDPEKEITQGKVNEFHPEHHRILLDNTIVYLSSTTLVFTPEGLQVPISDFIPDVGMTLELVCQSFLDGCFTPKIQIITE